MNRHHMSTTEIKFFTYAEARAAGRFPSNTTPCKQCAYHRSDTCTTVDCTLGLYLEVPDGPSHAEPAQEAAGTQAPPDQLSAPQALENAAQHLRDRAETYDSPDGERKAHAHSKTGFLGVSPKGSRYVAQIVVNGVHQHLGYFDTPEEAHHAYLSAKRPLHTGCTI